MFSLLTACAVNQPGYVSQPPRVTINTPAYTVTPGKSSVIQSGPISWGNNDSLVVIPSGPFVYQHYSPRYLPVDVVSHGEYVYVVGKSGNESILEILHFPAIGNALSINTTTLRGGVNKVYYASHRLLITRESGGIEILDVSNPAAPVMLAAVTTDQPVVDVQLDDTVAYLLLENNNLLKIQLSGNKTIGLKAALHQQWHLPFPARAIAIQEPYLWLTGKQGVGLVKLDNSMATPVALVATSGNPVDVQLHGEHVLVTDRSEGLLIYSIKDREELLWKGSYNKRAPFNRVLIPELQNGSPDNDSNKNSNNVGNNNDKKLFAVLDNDTLLTINLNRMELPGSGTAFKSSNPILSASLLQDDVLLVTRHDIQRIRMSANNSHAISPEGVNQGGSRRGVIRDNILYVADWFSGLHLYDISIPQQPRHLSNYHTPGSSKGVALYGNYVLIGDDDQGLQVVDIEDPHKPIWVSELSPGALSGDGLAYTMKRVDKTLYLADHRGGFHIIDLSDIYHPKRLGGYNTPGKSWGIDVSGNFVFVADDQSGLLIFDATEASNPKLVAQFDPDGQAEDVAIQDNRAYVAFFDKGLYVLDIQDPRQPAVLSHTPIPGNARGIELGDGLAYVTGWESGLHIVDTRGPATPRVIGTFDTDGSAWGVNVQDGYAYVLDWWGGIKVIDVRQPSSPSYAGQYHARGTLQQLRVR
ncbi:LVIVD repeat-containing protein, partial [Kaarinaea lacus]